MSHLMPEDCHWARPDGGDGAGLGTGVLVIAGSSGRIDTQRAQILAHTGVLALAIRWFGGVLQPPVPREVPLETFVEGINLLAAHCDRVVLMGLSYGAEAALLTATVDVRVAALVALSPTDVAWEGHRDRADEPAHSKWTWQGRPVPFVPLDQTHQPAGDHRPAFAPLYLHSRQVAPPEVVDVARIPVERIAGDVVVVAGGDDQVWPSLQAARAIEGRRREHGLATELVDDERAGHQIVLPGEAPQDMARAYAVGGDDDAPVRLGAAAWPAIRAVL